MPSTSVVLAAVAAGGAIGATGRYLIGKGLAGFGGTVLSVPAGTLVVNALGCFLAGLLVFSVDTRSAHSELLLAFAFTGVLGGFTTFSAFSVETLRLAHSGVIGLAALNVLLNVFVSLAGVVLGWQCIQALLR